MSCCNPLTGAGAPDRAPRPGEQPWHVDLTAMQLYFWTGSKWNMVERDERDSLGPVHLWDFLTAQQKTSVKATLTAGGYSTNLQAALDLAIAHCYATGRKWLQLPPGNLLITCLNQEASGTLPGGSALRISGAGTATKIKGAGRASDANKSVIRVAPATMFCTFGSFEDFVVDTADLADSAANAGIYLKKAFNFQFRRVHVLSTGVVKRTVLMHTGVYTTEFEGCDLGSKEGKVEILGVSLSDAVTTVSFVGQTAFAKLIAEWFVNITCANAVVQGDTDSKFRLRNGLGFTIRDCDIEGAVTSGAIVDATSTVGHFFAQGNQYSGVGGTHTFFAAEPARPFEYTVADPIFAETKLFNKGAVIRGQTALPLSVFGTSAGANNLLLNVAGGNQTAFQAQNGTSGQGAFFGVLAGGGGFIDSRGSATFTNYISGAPVFSWGTAGGNAILPGIDGTTNLGSAALRFGTVFAATGSINTSDARAKTAVAALNKAELATAKALKGLIRTYKFKEGKRTHVGVIAQEVEKVFAANGLNGFDYGVLCYDKGTLESGEAFDRYGVRYDELMLFMLAALP